MNIWRKAREAFRREPVDSSQLEIPVGFHRPPSLQEQVRRLVRYEMSQEAANQGQETFEEADDFDVGDDFDPSSPYELNFDQESFREERPVKGQMKEEEPEEKPAPKASKKAQVKSKPEPSDDSVNDLD